MAQSMGPFDYVIIGAGSAGCLLANRLSADANTRVLLLEAGGKDDYFWIHVPVGYLYTIGNPRTDWCYRTEADDGLNGRTLGYARGLGLGGCSSINAMIYMRGQKSDYDHWSSLGNRGWAWDEVLPYFIRTEDYAHGADELHGVGGELRVEERRVNWEILDAWRDAAEECGIPKIQEFNRGDNFGNAYFQMNQKRGVRWSNTKAFLRPVMHRPNLAVLTHAHVSRVRFDTANGNRRATGVEFRTGQGGNEFAEAKREVVLSAGAIGSPQILQLSGIGPGSLLQESGVPVIHDLSGVGENLQDHLQIRIMYKVKNTVTLNERTHSLIGKMAMGMEYLFYRTGPLTMPPSQLGAFARSDPSQMSANIEWHVQPLSLEKFGEPLHPFPAITPSVCNLRPTSRGHVRIKGSDPQMHPAIKLNYLSTEEDKRVAVDSIHITRRIMKAKALEKFQPEEFKPGPGIATDEALRKAAGDLGTTIFHPVGTCKMGRDELAVVDDRLRVRGVRGLRVVDASVMPRITSGNTNAPTTMIAEKGAEMLREDWKP
ncbi:MAG: GMC family oxidoreductase N-terminal domain-containing protein [Betaproteobacteria bacterium]|nr:GMC family oxidoreductase N-terminal domain-containing protein [Betaproteobacteria bacterium]